jgi:cell division transport system permease protein
MSSIHLRTAFSNIRRSPFQAVAAIFVLTLTFFVATVIATMVYSSNQLLRHFETRPQIIAFLKDPIAAEDVSALQRKLQDDSRIKEVRYVTKEEALSIYKEATSENPLLGELVSPSIFPASLEFSLTDLSFAEDVISNVKEESVVDQVGFTASLGGESTLQETVNRLRSIAWYVRIGGGVFSGILLLTSFFVLLIIISMRLTTRRHEVEILDLIGATPGFIRSPIILEAIVYSFVGVFLGWVLAFILILYSAPNIISYFDQIKVLPRDTVELFYLFGIMLAVELFIGFILALMGSSIAVSRARKRS